MKKYRIFLTASILCAILLLTGCIPNFEQGGDLVFSIKIDGLLSGAEYTVHIDLEHQTENKSDSIDIPLDESGRGFSSLSNLKAGMWDVKATVYEEAIVVGEESSITDIRLGERTTAEIYGTYSDGSVSLSFKWTADELNPSVSIDQIVLYYHEEQSPLSSDEYNMTLIASGAFQNAKAFSITYPDGYTFYAGTRGEPESIVFQYSDSQMYAVRHNYSATGEYSLEVLDTNGLSIQTSQSIENNIDDFSAPYNVQPDQLNIDHTIDPIDIYWDNGGPYASIIVIVYPQNDPYNPQVRQVLPGGSTSLPSIPSNTLTLGITFTLLVFGIDGYVEQYMIDSLSSYHYKDVIPQLVNQYNVDIEYAGLFRTEFNTY